MDIIRTTYIEQAIVFSLYENKGGELTLFIFREDGIYSETLCCVENIAPENVESCLSSLKDWPSWGSKITGREEIKLIEQRIKNTDECATFAAGTALVNGKIIGIIASNAGKSSQKALANFSQNYF